MSEAEVLTQAVFPDTFLFRQCSFLLLAACRAIAHVGWHCAEMKKSGEKLVVLEKKFVTLQPVSECICVAWSSLRLI